MRNLQSKGLFLRLILGKPRMVVLVIPVTLLLTVGLGPLSEGLGSKATSLPKPDAAPQARLSDA